MGRKCSGLHCVLGNKRTFHTLLLAFIDSKRIPSIIGSLLVRAANIDLTSCTVQSAIQRIADVYQVDYVTLHLFRSGEDAQNKPYVRTNYPDSWVSRYLLNDYVRIDPVLHMAEQVAGPFCWSTITPEGDQIEMMEQAAKYGLGQTGFSVRHVDAIGRRSVLSFNARDARGGKTWEPHLAEMREGLIQLAHQLHHMALDEIYVDGNALPQLTPREIECLMWTAKGKAHTDIAVILGLSEHTIRGYLKDARMKLDCVTLAQAVSKASALGLIH
jgi:DNA-binding CsgD family transcriptional regulator